ncbi:MAG: signal peptidase I [Acidimicrobiales bacterium]|nr:signal peptidase I [Acidimicrobiales bacterium]
MTDSGSPGSGSDEPLFTSVGPRPRGGAPTPSGPTAAGDGDGGGSDDAFWLDETAEPEPESSGKLNGQIRTLTEWVVVAIGALAVALLIKAFLLQAFYIPSPSMDPTLRNDDRVLVNKLSYRLGDVERGDIIVFERPEDVPSDTDDFIKRAIGLPGEVVTFSDGAVFIDGRALSEDYVGEHLTTNDRLIPGCDNAPAVADSCLVPEGHVFVMGDNRDASLDSRSFGPIDEDTIVGRAFLKVWPLGDIGFL